MSIITYMNKERSLFLALLIVEVLLFGLCGYSLVQCFVYDSSLTDGGSHFLEITYLFLHLVMVAIIFYLTFRAFKIKPSIIHLMMLDENESKTTKSLIISGVIAALFLFMGIYSTLFVCGLKLPPLDIFSLGLVHDLMNAGYLIGFIALTFFLFPFVHVKEDK